MTLEEAQQRAKPALNAFAIQLEATIGTQDTTALLERLTKFITETPESVQLLQQTVHANEEQFNSLLTRQGIETIGAMISMAESGDIFSHLI